MGVQLCCVLLNEVARGAVVGKHSPEVAARERAKTKGGNSRAPLFPVDRERARGEFGWNYFGPISRRLPRAPPLP